MARVVSTVTSPRGTKQLYDTDLIWVVKLMSHEPGGRGPAYEIERDAVAWTVLIRWMGPPGDNNPTLASLIGEFSQPINRTQIGRIMSYDYRAQSLADDPVECSGAEGSEMCAMLRAQARWTRIVANIKRPIEAYSADVVLQAGEWLLGKRPNCRFPGWADFAAKFATPTAGRVSTPGLQPDSNAFFRESWSRTWDVDAVQINGRRCRSSRRNAILGVLGGALLGAVGLAAVHHRATGWTPRFEPRLWLDKIRGRIP